MNWERTSQQEMIAQLLRGIASNKRQGRKKDNSLNRVSKELGQSAFKIWKKTKTQSKREKNLKNQNPESYGLTSRKKWRQWSQTIQVSIDCFLHKKKNRKHRKSWFESIWNSRRSWKESRNLKVKTIQRSQAKCFLTPASVHLSKTTSLNSQKTKKSIQCRIPK